MFFRLILAFPHILIVGTPGSLGWTRFLPGPAQPGPLVALIDDGNGVLGIVALGSTIISWFLIVLTGKQPRGLWDFTSFFLRWRAKAISYMALLRDEYPPFGEGNYPISFSVGEFPDARNRLSVAFRIILAIPQIIVLLLLQVAWFITLIIGWFSILITGSYPDGLYKFGVGYLRWSLRVEAYVLLMQDQYPPFSLD